MEQVQELFRESAKNSLKEITSIFAEEGKWNNWTSVAVIFKDTELRPLSHLVTVLSAFVLLPIILSPPRCAFSSFGILVSPREVKLKVNNSYLVTFERKRKCSQDFLELHPEFRVKNAMKDKLRIHIGLDFEGGVNTYGNQLFVRGKKAALIRYFLSYFGNKLKFEGYGEEISPVFFNPWKQKERQPISILLLDPLVNFSKAHKNKWVEQFAKQLLFLLLLLFIYFIL